MWLIFTMTEKLVLIGAGGHAKSCVGVIESNKRFAIQGFIDPKLTVGTDLLGYPVLGGNEVIDELCSKGDIQFIIAVGQVNSPDVRMQLFALLESRHAIIAAGISAASAFVSPHATCGRGTIVMQQVTVNTGARIGDNVILNNHCLVEHDAVIGDHVHISTGAIVNGDCTIGNGCFIGSGSVIVHGLSVTSNTIVGAGAVVVSNIIEPGTYAGNPARKIK